MRRDLASRAVLIAAGVGTALGAGAGLANAAPLEQDLQQDQSGQNAFDQSLPTDALTSAAPNLSLTDGLPTAGALPTAGLPVSGDALTGLAGNGLLSGLGSNGGNVDQGATDEAADQATDQAQQSGDQAQPTADTAMDSGSDSGSGGDTASYGS